MYSRCYNVSHGKKNKNWQRKILTIMQSHNECFVAAIIVAAIIVAAVGVQQAYETGFKISNVWLNTLGSVT